MRTRSEVPRRLGTVCLVAILAAAGGASPGLAAVATDYFWVQSTSTYTEITGGTVHGTASNDDGSFNAVNLGFTFTYDGVAYTQVSLQSNGFLAMGATVSSSYTPLSSGTSNNVVSAVGRDIQGNGTTAELMSLLEGTAPNRVFTVQWKHYKRWGSSYVGDDFNFQIKLHETTNLVQIVYGPFTVVTVATPPTVQVGLRGASNADFNNRMTGATGWTDTVPGVANNSFMNLTDAIFPPSGLTWTWTYDQPPPNVNVDPLSLLSTQPADTIISWNMTIGNTGSETLLWELLEAQPTRFASRGDAPVANPSLTTSFESGVAGHPSAPPATLAVLWDQPLSTVNQNAYVNQEFSDYPASSSFLADDFVAGDPWTIESIFVPGSLWNGGTTVLNATALTWMIFADAGGVPAGDPSGAGAPPVWSLALPPADAQVLVSTGSGGLPSDVTLNLSAPVSIPAGTYWLVFYPTMGFTAGGQFGRQPADTAHGATGQFINPGGGFGFGTAWQAWTVIGATQTDIAFRIEGTIGTTGCTPSSIAWLSANPTDGSIPGGGNTPVTVTFDSTGLALGTYEANLCVLSNDPDPGPGNGTDLVIVPVTLEVIIPPPTSINLTKTVGTVPGVCAATTAITVPIGTEVYYCYQVENTGEATLTLHDLVDGELGSLLVAFPYTLAPGAFSPEVIVPATPLATVTNTATWTAYNPGPLDVASDQASATVTVIAPNIDVSPLNLISTQPPDTTANQILTIGNSGTADLIWEVIEAQESFTTRPGIQAAPEPVFDVPAEVTSKSDCAAFENYPGREPRGWAQFCAPSYGLDAAPLEPPVAPLGPTSTGYAQDIGYISDNFVTFALNDFTGQTVVGTNTAAYFGMDFDAMATTLYALNDTTGQLGTINLANGSFTAIVACIPPGGGSWTGLTIDPVTNEFYASTTANLYRLDPVTCSPVLVGPFGPTLMIDIAMGPQGVMYGHDISTDLIYTIDTTTGAATAVGPTGYNANYAQGMDFDNEDGTLYIWLYIGSGANVYGTVDLATGAVTPLATSAPLGEFEGATQTVAYCAPTDYPWLSLAPTGGTTAAGGSTPVTATFDSTGLAEGTYTGQVCVRSNDPDSGPGNGTNLVIVPVTLNVEILQEPGISLVKTVGTTPGVCAATTEITVPAGTTVYYCFEVTNTGTITLPVHDLGDNQLGTLFTGLLYDLTPGSSIDTVAAGLSFAAVINVDTTNTALWSAYDGQLTATAQASATVNVIPQVTVTVLVGTPGAGTVSGGGPYTIGDMATVTATPNPGWTFLHWLVNGSEITDNPYTFEVTGDTTLTAIFQRQVAEPIPTTGSVGLILLLGLLLGVGVFVLRRMA